MIHFTCIICIKSFFYILVLKKPVVFQELTCARMKTKSTMKWKNLHGKGFEMFKDHNFERNRYLKIFRTNIFNQIIQS